MNILIPTIYPPLSVDVVDKIDGRQRGIQGHRNSCYLDATLFAMYSFSSVFDTILVPSAGADDQEQAELSTDVKTVLRDEIVNPLRKSGYAPAANVMKLRERMLHLDKKLTTEEMDPQEYLQLLFNKVLNLPEFISLSTGSSDYFHQLIHDINTTAVVPTIQQLLDKSLVTQKLKFKSIPSPALILQMPRSGNQYKMFDGILPNLEIDITDLLEETPRSCIICGSLATSECLSCFGQFPSISKSSGADSTSFCGQCSAAVHSRSDRTTHSITQIQIPLEAKKKSTTGLLSGLFNNNKGQSQTVWPRVKMNLFAVICIETSHFVSFVKTGPGREDPWVFFDSMADRVERMDGSGHNIPQVKLLPKMGTWLSKLEDEPMEIKSKMDSLNSELKRLLTDPYICLYHSPLASMYS